MRYLDQYVRLAAAKFENELERVAQFDDQAKLLYEEQKIRTLIRDIKQGSVKPPSNAFEGYANYFLPDEKYSHWSSDLLCNKKELGLFAASAELGNVLRYRDDDQFSSYCRRIGYTFPDGWPNK